MITLQVRRISTGTADGYGDATTTYATARPWDVWWLAPGAIQEFASVERDASVVVWTVGAPVTPEAPTEFDRVVVDGKEFAVNGRPADWTRGPVFNSAAGLIVELRRADG